MGGKRGLRGGEVGFREVGGVQGCGYIGIVHLNPLRMGRGSGPG